MMQILERALSQSEPTREYTISELAEEFGITARAIRFYEDHGLIAPRRIGTMRVYSHRDRARLMLVLRGKRLGFSLSEIREWLDLYALGDEQQSQLKTLIAKCSQRRLDLKRQRQDIEQTLSELDEIERLAKERLRTLGVTAAAS